MAERLNRTLKEDFNVKGVLSFCEASEVIEQVIKLYNDYRPHVLALSQKHRQKVDELGISQDSQAEDGHVIFERPFLSFRSRYPAPKV